MNITRILKMKRMGFIMKQVSLKIGLVFVLSLSFFGVLNTSIPTLSVNAADAQSITYSMTRTYVGGYGPSSFSQFGIPRNGRLYVGTLYLTRTTYTGTGTTCYYSGTLYLQ